jgi:general secretion pathway protein L
MTLASAIIVRFPDSESDNPVVWQVADGVWQDAGFLHDATFDPGEATVMAVASPVVTRCIWSLLPDLEPKQAEGVARIRASEESLGPVHSAARHLGEDKVVTATIATAEMERGLSRLMLAGLNPDIVIPLPLALSRPEQIVAAEFDGIALLRGPEVAAPDEPLFRNLLVAQSEVETLGNDAVRNMLLQACEAPLLNLRQGPFVKREQRTLATDSQREWIKRLVAGLAVASLLLALVTLGKYSIATNAENDRALAAAQKIDPSIIDVEQAEVQVNRALQQRGQAAGRFVPLSAGLWRTVKASPNVSVRELRYGADGILTVVLAAPDANSVNRALVAIQQDGYRITATPRQDASGATLVDMTMRMP